SDSLLRDFAHHIQLTDAPHGLRLSDQGGDERGPKSADVLNSGVGSSRSERLVERVERVRLVETNDTAQRAMGAQVAGEGARVQLAHAWDASLSQIVLERLARAPVAILLAILPHQKRREPGPARLHILGCDAVVAN